MDYQLEKVTLDRVSIFATISSISRTMHTDPLLDLGVSSLQFDVTSSGDLTASVDSPIVTTEQDQVPPMGDEVNMADEGQSVDDMPQDQLVGAPVI